MHRSVLTALVATLALLATASPAESQKKEKLPKRPKLETTSDTNDPRAFYQLGLATITKHPHRAADAFYWAHRLAPYWGDPLYGRGIALLMGNDRRLWGYVVGDRGILKSKEVRLIDSLEALAILRDPFLFQGLDRNVLDQFVYLASNGEQAVANFSSADPSINAWRAYTNGQFARSADLYARAIERWPKAIGLRAARARSLYHLQQYDLAASELKRLIADWKQKEDKELVRLYESKAMFEYQLAMTYLMAQRIDDAREALGRALLEDLSFYMAHARLGMLALATGDTTTAINELELAVQANGDDGALRYMYGDLLASAGRHEEAVAQLAKASELEPYYAAPHLLLGRCYEKIGKLPEALAAYRAFTERAAAYDGGLVEARARLTALASATSAQ